MSKTITVIQLLNKIANGEEPPEKIRISGHSYKYNKETKDYDSDNGFDNKDLFLHIGILEELNTSIIIEEQEEIDIQAIKENNSTNARADVNQENINLLIKAVKQLDKNIKEKKDYVL